MENKTQSSFRNTAPQPYQTKWNWGAFALTIAFAFGNKAYLGLLGLVPFLNLFWVFVAGFNGEDWARDANTYGSEAEFRAVMDSWNRAGFAMFIILIIVAVLAFLFMFFMSAAMIGGMTSGY